MASLDGLQDTVILVGPSWTAVTSVGGKVPRQEISDRVYGYEGITSIPCTVMLAESADGLLLATVQV